MILMIDNYDSFTYNLVQYLGELGAEVAVHRNDQLSLDDIQTLSPKKIMISPGPGTPSNAGISLEVIEEFKGKIPIFGVCLGHQAIAQAFGGKIIRAGRIMHGKTSLIYHTAAGVFSGLKNPYTATRYHSLVIDKNSIPDCLEITAWTETEDGGLDEVMAIRHKTLNIQGVQFHPESILSEHGHDMLRNFIGASLG